MYGLSNAVLLCSSLQYCIARTGSAPEVIKWQRHYGVVSFSSEPYSFILLRQSLCRSSGADPFIFSSISTEPHTLCVCVCVLFVYIYQLLTYQVVSSSSLRFVSNDGMNE